MFKDKEENKHILIYNPLSIFYLLFLFLLTNFLLPYLFFAGRLISHALGVPFYIIFVMFLFSFFGSHINIKVKEKEVSRPIMVLREINFFGIQWHIPEFGYGIRKTVIALNVGGALIPTLFSLYLLFYSVPLFEQDLTVAYLKILASFIVVTLTVHVFAKPIKGFGIAVPSFIPPLTATLISAFLFSIYIRTNPFIIAYVSGTLGTLVGADLLNLNKISELGAPVVSIGGAGIFDGIYMTGIMSIFLLWLII